MTFGHQVISQNWKVIKLGGTSQSKIGYDNLIDLLKTNNEYNFAIVLSAVSGVTNLLELYVKTLDNKYLDSVKEKNINLIKELNLDNFDELISEMFESFSFNLLEDTMYNKSKIIGFGECLSTKIFHTYLNRTYVDDHGQLMNSYDFIKSKKESFKLYQNLEFEGNFTKFTEKYDGSSRIIICQGFIASTPGNKTILLGRGGSDTSGSLIANMLTAIEYQVWTDVDGIYFVDPRIINNSKNVKTISYDLAQEISSMGAKIMHPYSILPCAIKNIPIIVRNTFNLGGCFTVIEKHLYDINNDIFFAIQKNITLFKIFSVNMWNAYGLTADIFRIFEKIGIDINIITTSQFSIYVTTDEKDNLKIQQALLELSESYKTEIIETRSIVSIMANNVKKYMAKINYDCIESDIIHIGSNGMTINFVVDQKDSCDIVTELYGQLVI